MAASRKTLDTKGPGVYVALKNRSIWLPAEFADVGAFHQLEDGFSSQQAEFAQELTESRKDEG